MASSSTFRRTVGVLVFDGVEVLGFAGPFEVFAGATSAGKIDEASCLSEVVTIAPEQRPIR